MNVNRIRRIALDKGYPSLSSLEKACGLGNGTIGKWETRNPSGGSLRKVASVLGVSISELIGERAAPEESEGKVEEFEPNISGVLMFNDKNSDNPVTQMLYFYIDKLDAGEQADLLIELIEKAKSTGQKAGADKHESL